jgi:hypothetical protein
MSAFGVSTGILDFTYAGEAAATSLFRGDFSADEARTLACRAAIRCFRCGVRWLRNGLNYRWQPHRAEEPSTQLPWRRRADLTEAGQLLLRI